MTARAARPEAAQFPVDRDEVSLTTAVVDLAAIRANVSALKRWVQPARLQIVVKANGYGHGAVPVARAALQAGADSIGVYTPSEGEELRSAGLDAPILVFGPFTMLQAKRMAAIGLTPTVTSVEGAEILQRAAARRTIPFHLKLDTGLNRSGLSAADVLPFVRSLDRWPSLRLDGLFTHFASADEVDKSLTLRQLGDLLAIDGGLHEAGLRVPLRHAANSAATLDLPPAHLDMVRCGIATYGIYPSTDVSRALRLTPAMSLFSTLTRVHRVPTGCGVGYGHEHRCGADSIIGLAPIGYGDGLLRSLGNGRGRVLVRGRLAPVIGRISMDQITIDVTGVAGARSGDQVTLIGRDGDAVHTADDMAMEAGTIAYDVLTKLLPRVPRVYRNS
jgi:alanine racemase